MELMATLYEANVETMDNLKEPTVYGLSEEQAKSLALNTEFRKTLEDNINALDKLSLGKKGELLFDGNPIKAEGVGESIDPRVTTAQTVAFLLEQNVITEVVTEAPDVASADGSDFAYKMSELVLGYALLYVPTEDGVLTYTAPFSDAVEMRVFAGGIYEFKYDSDTYQTSVEPYLGVRLLEFFKSKILEGYLTEEQVDAKIQSVDVDLSEYYTKQVIDETFAKKSEIPTDESYELVGQTPLTLENGGNIKLVADGEVTFDIYTPTVANADDITPRLSNCSLSTEKGYYEFSVTNGSASRTNIYAEYIFEGLTVGEEYNLLSDINGLTVNDTTNKIWSGNITVWHGNTTATDMMIASGHYLYKGALNFTAQSDKILVRYYLAQNPAPFDGWIAHFNKMYINKANTSNELTEIYNKTATFTDVVALKGIPSKAIVTTNPTASAYRKAPTDKTLTQSDVPADAKVTGKEIANVKSYLPLYGKTIVNFGDSIFGNAQPPVDISTYLAEKTGATVYNCGFGGCRMSQHVSAWDAFSMYRLADSIVSGDFTLQETALESTEVDLPDRFTPSVERLKGIDFSKVDIVTIAYGTNDFTSNIAMDNEENPFDTTALAGALRYSIEKLLTAYPNLNVFVLSTAYRAWVDSDNGYAFLYDSNTFANGNGVKLADYNSKLKEVAEDYNLPFVDDYNIGINQFNRLQYFPVADGTHHNETGRKLIASHLAKELY